MERGRELARAGNAQGAIEEWRTAIGLAPLLPMPYFAIAELHEERGELRQAFQALENLKRANPQEKHVTCKQSEILLKSDRWHAAHTAALEALKSTPDCPLAHTVLASVLVMAGDRRGAVDHLMKAHRAAPQSARVALTCAQVLAETGRAQEALQIVNSLPKEARETAQAQYLLGRIARRVNGPGTDAGESRLKAALQQDPNHALTHAELGLLLHSKRDEARAREHLRRAIDGGVATPELLRALAETEKSLGLRTAPETLKQSQALAHRDEQLRQARSAYLADPKSRRNRLLLARTESRYGNRADAIVLATSILEENPDDEEALDLIHRLTNTARRAP